MLDAVRIKVKTASDKLDEHKQKVAVAEAAVKVQQKILAEATGVLQFHTCDQGRVQKMEELYRCELAGLRAYTDTSYPASWETWLGTHGTCRDAFETNYVDCQPHLPGYTLRPTIVSN